MVNMGSTVSEYKLDHENLFCSFFYLQQMIRIFLFNSQQNANDAGSYFSIIKKNNNKKTEQISNIVTSVVHWYTLGHFL